MTDKKDFNFLAKQLTALVDFIKWTSSFSSGTVEQMEVPVTGIRLAPATTHLFGLAMDDHGWMLVMHEQESSWLADLPFSEAYVGFGDGLILVTEEVTIFEQPFPQLGIDIFVPELFMREELMKKNLLGFGLIRKATGQAERVNKIVPLYNPDTYEEARRVKVRKGARGLFSQQ